MVFNDQGTGETMNTKDSKSQENPLILIVDDAPVNLQVLSGLLTGANYEIAAAIDGEEAISVASHVFPDIILLDIIMPGLDGYEVCKRLKARPQTKDIPIIFLTAKTEPEDIMEGFQIGGADYVTKPFNSKELLTKVHTHLELKKTRERQKELISKLQEKIEEISKAESLKQRTRILRRIFSTQR
ncbi:MAG: hypothetical protein DRI57_26335 [Deltaproteobacteria bacterium]|nr:MAG: hypothetical protein DRI57_26335 [Deltaproteobacteria bacterium]